MTLVVDASVAVKWLVREDDSEAAKQLIAAEPLVAPDLLLIECANVLRTKRRRGDLSAELARGALDLLEAAPVRLVPTRSHVAMAYAIATELDRSAYDALYLAVALSNRATLVTADAKFANAAFGHPVYRDALRLLGASDLSR